MKIYAPNRDFSEFLNFLASKRRDFHSWQLLTVLQSQATGAPLPFEDIFRFVDPFLPQERPVSIFVMRPDNQMLLIGDDQNQSAFQEIEKRLPDAFRAHRVHVENCRLDRLGLEKISRILKPHLQTGNVSQKILFDRLCRFGNHIMVVDDNPMVLKQLERILADFGSVRFLHSPDKFEEQYSSFAPDVLFLDIHLRSAMGNEMLRNLRHKIDPYAHVIMISGDTEERMVHDIKKGGAKGFIAKPFTRNHVFQHLMRAPTFVPPATPPAS